MSLGATQWQDDITDWPLILAGNLAGIFSDASFIQYDNFTPILKGVEVAGSNLNLTLLLDDGVSTFTCSTSLANQGSSFNLANNVRTYGSLVFGRNIANIVGGVYGNPIQTNLVFEAITVRTINSNNGVYSLNGLSGHVAIVVDDNMNITSNSGQPIFNAVSVPSNLTYINTPPNDILLGSTSKQVVDINVTSNTNLIIATLDRAYNCIINTGTRLIGSLTVAATTTNPITSSIYDLTSLPATLLVSGIEHTIHGLAWDGSSLWCVIGDAGFNVYNSIMNLGGYPFSGSTTYTTNLALTSLSYINNSLIGSVSGDIDYSISSPITYFSSMLYSMVPSSGATTNTAIGLMSTIGGNSHLDPVICLTTNNNNLYALTYSTLNGNTIYQINTSNLIATQVASYLSDPITQTITTCCAGGINIDITPIQPLKTINGVGVDLNNNINLIPPTSSPISLNINSTISDTITISLPINDSSLNVTRTTSYA